MSELSRTIEELLLATLFVAPTQLGLTPDELEELLLGMGYRPGEIGDALRAISFDTQERATLVADRIGPQRFLVETKYVWWTQLDDLRDIRAYDYVFDAIADSIRELGQRNAGVSRDVLLERATSKRLDVCGCEVALATYLYCGFLAETNGIVRPAPRFDATRRPSTDAKHNRAKDSGDAHAVSQHVERVRAVAARRGQGHPLSTDPLRAFGEMLPSPQRLWWAQMTGEWRTLDRVAHPSSRVVVAAALLEGLLVYLAPVARAAGYHLIDDGRWESGPSAWNLNDLVSRAGKGEAPIFPRRAIEQAKRLVELRKRIHAGHYIAKGASTDLRAEEVIESDEALLGCARAGLEWLSAKNLGAQAFADASLPGS